MYLIVKYDYVGICSPHFRLEISPRNISQRLGVRYVLVKINIREVSLHSSGGKMTEMLSNVSIIVHGINVRISKLNVTGIHACCLCIMGCPLTFSNRSHPLI